MPQDVFTDLIRKITPYCSTKTAHNSVPLVTRVLCALKFYASGFYQKVVGDSTSVSVCQASVSNYVTELTNALNHRDVLTEFVHFPNTVQEREETIKKNHRLGLPRVLGFVDGSLVKHFPPTHAEHREGYYCRKGYTAINVQLVCDADLIILAVDASFLGSCNDAYIFNKSGMRQEMTAAYRESSSPKEDIECWIAALRSTCTPTSRMSPGRSAGSTPRRGDGPKRPRRVWGRLA